MDKTHVVLTIAVASLVTVGLRFLPFLIFSGKRQTPPVISYLSAGIVAASGEGKPLILVDFIHLLIHFLSIHSAHLY